MHINTELISWVGIEITLVCVQCSLQCTVSSQVSHPLCSPSGAVAFYPPGHKGLDFIPVESSLSTAGGLEVLNL